MQNNLPLPKYHQIYLVLREQLKEGKFEQGLPSELLLTKQFGVGRVTVRRALQELAGEGLIKREPGRGPRPVDAWINTPDIRNLKERPIQRRLTGLMENIVKMSLQTSVKVLKLENLLPLPAVQHALQIEADERVYKIIRVRSSADSSLSYITAHVPVRVLPVVNRQILKRNPILMLIEKNGVSLGRVHQTITARQADGDVALALDVKVGSALLQVERIIFDANDKPVQLLQGLYRPDRYVYHIDISEVGNLDARIWILSH
ncbi:MAG: GntR family transcriptional regulator [Limnohabitans sp.]|nr:GntR family transcriptional regulator [Limnohabitans sp.]